MSDPVAAGREILARNRYAVLATADGSGPWATPVWYAADGLDLLLWVSRPGSRHSRALARDPRLAVTVFDATVEPGHGTAFYGRGRGGECGEDDLDRHLATYSARSETQGLAAWGRDRVTGDAPFRLYVAVLDEVSVLLDTDGPEQRLPVGPGIPR